jgi:hypothetical protein
MSDAHRALQRARLTGHPAPPCADGASRRPGVAVIVRLTGRHLDPSRGTWLSRTTTQSASAFRASRDTADSLQIPQSGHNRWRRRHRSSRARRSAVHQHSDRQLAPPCLGKARAPGICCALLHVVRSGHGRTGARRPLPKGMRARGALAPSPRRFRGSGGAGPARCFWWRSERLRRRRRRCRGCGSACCRRSAGKRVCVNSSRGCSGVPARACRR